VATDQHWTDSSKAQGDPAQTQHGGSVVGSQRR